MIKVPNIVSKDGKAVCKAPAALDLAETNAIKLLDELCVASQWQLVCPVASMRREWRQRMNECHAELRKRLMAKGGA